MSEYLVIVVDKLSLGNVPFRLPLFYRVGIVLLFLSNPINILTSQMFTKFTALCSQNFVHNCNLAAFNVDCCCDILQRLLRTVHPLRHLL